MNQNNMDVDCLESLMEMKNQIQEIIGSAREIVNHAPGVIGQRAESYWLSHIEQALESEFSMGSMEDTIQEIRESIKGNQKSCFGCGLEYLDEGENDEDDLIDIWDDGKLICPKCYFETVESGEKDDESDLQSDLHCSGCGLEYLEAGWKRVDLNKIDDELFCPDCGI